MPWNESLWTPCICWCAWYQHHPRTSQMDRRAHTQTSKQQIVVSVSCWAHHCITHESSMSDINWEAFPGLIRPICHPESVKFRSAATTWGCTYEKTALEDYKAAAIHTHDSLVISESGLVVNPDYPEIGASPDAVVYCSCCGQGLVEVKCPYCATDPAEHKCLTTDDTGCTTLDINHEYYFIAYMFRCGCRNDWT